MSHDMRLETEAPILRTLADVPGLADDAMFSFGSPSEAQMTELRTRGILLDDEIKPEELFTWTIQAINNLTHSKSMWMDPATTLAIFGAQASTMRGIPYLRDHDTGNGTTGRVFAGRVIEDAVETHERVEPGADLDFIPSFRQLFRDPAPVSRLYEQVYMLREGTPEEQAHVNKIRAGIQASVSVGLSLYGALEPGSKIICDACGVDMFRVDYSTCPHFPGGEYEVAIANDGRPGADPEGEDVEVIRALATAQVVSARQREVSGVYQGAVPDSFTQRGRELYAEGLMPRKQARHLEHLYRMQHGTIVGDEQTHSIPRPTRVLRLPGGKAKAVAPAGTIDEAARGAGDHKETTSMNEREMVERLRELFDNSPEAWADLQLLGVDKDPLKAMSDLYARACSDAEKAATDHDAVVARIGERLGAQDGETIDDALTRVEGAVKLAGEVRDRLVAEYAKQSTRAQLPIKKDEAATLTAGWSIEQLEAQTARLKKLANGSLKPGTIGTKVVEDRHGEPGDGEPAPKTNGRVRGGVRGV